MTESIRHITDLADYKKAITESPCIVKFTANWCGPCKRIGPRYRSLSEQHGSKAKFLEIDIDDVLDVTDHENVQGIPLFLFYLGGAKLNEFRISGASESLLVENVAKFISKIPEPEPEVKHETEIVIPPTPIKVVDISRLTLDNVVESDSESDADDAVNPGTQPTLDYSSDTAQNEYGEDCDLPIEKTIPEDMIKNN